MSVVPLDPATQQLLTSLQSDYDATTPDAHIIARQVVYQKQRKGQKPPKQTDLAFSITGISSDQTTGAAGAPTLTITMQDPSWTLLDSGFFDTDANGRLLDLDLNYPEGSRFWWRLQQVSPQQDRSVQLVFVPRIVAEAMGIFGPVKVDRAKRTRAEFLKMLCAKVHDAQGPIEFYSRELDIKQPIGTTSTSASKSSAKSPAKKAAKTKGIGANNRGLTVKGSPMNATQQRNATLIMQVGDKLSASDVALQACVFAAIFESNIGVNTTWNPSYGGLLAGAASAFGRYGAHNSEAVAIAEITSFMNGGNGYQAGGAIKLSTTHTDPAYIASQVEAPYPFDQRGYSMQYLSEGFPFDKAIAEAQAIVQNGGGGSGVVSATAGTTIEVAQPYYFMVNAGEDYWTAMNRLAQEVGWELIVDGDRIYYDADTVLIRQKVAAVIERDDPTTFAWNYDWENRHIATNFQIQVAVQPFELCAGEVVQVKSFGAASTGSTAKLPGRWLINEIAHNSGDVYSTLSLVQPSAPKPEPAPQFTSKTLGGAASGSLTISGSIQSQTPATAEAAYAAAQYLASLKLVYSRLNRTLVRGVGNLAGKELYDCSASVSWVLLAAGFQLPGGVTWGGWAPVSGAYTPGAAGLLAGPGQYMTIYANAEHIFIRIHPQGLADMQGNTVSPLVHERGFDFFPWATSGCGGWGGPSPGVGAPAFSQVHYPGT